MFISFNCFSNPEKGVSLFCSSRVGKWTSGEVHTWPPASRLEDKVSNWPQHYFSRWKLVAPFQKNKTHPIFGPYSLYKMWTLWLTGTKNYFLEWSEFNASWQKGGHIFTNLYQLFSFSYLKKQYLTLWFPVKMASKASQLLPKSSVFQLSLISLLPLALACETSSPPVSHALSYLFLLLPLPLFSGKLFALTAARFALLPFILGTHSPSPSLRSLDSSENRIRCSSLTPRGEYASPAFDLNPSSRSEILFPL